MNTRPALSSHLQRLSRLAFVTLLGVVVNLVSSVAPALSPASAAEMEHDPKGFQGIPWGASLAELPDLVLVESGERITVYERKDGPGTLGEIRVDSLRFSTIDGKFARVTIRYRGNGTHDRMLAYLQTLFGPVDRTPGSMLRGLNQEFIWRGPETGVNVTYDGHRERGVVFIESRSLAPKFSESIGDA